MKSIFIIAFLLSVVNNIKAQQDTFSILVVDSSFQVPIGVSSITPDFKNGYLVAGDIFYQGLIVRFDSNMDIDWSKRYQSDISNAKPMFFSDIIPTSDSNFIVAGFTWDTFAEVVCLKLNQQGDTIWSKKFGLSKCTLKSINAIETSDKGVLLTIDAQLMTIYNKLLIIKLDKYGEVEWHRTFNDLDETNSVKQTEDSCFVLTGSVVTFSNYSYYYNAFLVKISPSGIILWSRMYYSLSSSPSIGYDIEISYNGYLLLLTSDSYANLLKTDRYGNIIWCKAYSISINENNSFYKYTAKLTKTNDNNYVIMHINEYGRSPIYKVDSLGNLIWSRKICLAVQDIVETPNNELLIVGDGMSFICKSPTMKRHYGIFQTDSTGNMHNCVDTILINYLYSNILTDTMTVSLYSRSIIVSQLQLFEDDVTTLKVFPACVGISYFMKESDIKSDIKVYPNPAKDKLYIEFNRMIKANTKFELYNILGQYIASYILPENTNKCELILPSVAEGVYSYRLSENNSLIVEDKLVILGKD